jgi:CRP/FNR family cyclic AMP-dependent transcriptional regulator
MGVGMAHQHSFDPQTFLAHIGAGRTIVAGRAQSSIFSQGSAADAVFYIQEGKVKLTVVSARGKEAVIAILEPQSFFGEGLPGRAAAAYGDGHSAH